VQEIKKLHEQVKARIEKSNLSCQSNSCQQAQKVVFQPGGLVWIHLRKERFSSKRKSKLMPRANGPFEVLECCLNDNAYKVDLPGYYGVSTTLNAVDLSPYLDDDYLIDLRANASNKGRMMETHPCQPLTAQMAVMMV